MMSDDNREKLQPMDTCLYTNTNNLHGITIEIYINWHDVAAACLLTLSVQKNITDYYYIFTLFSVASIDISASLSAAVEAKQCKASYWVNT